MNKLEFFPGKRIADQFVLEMHRGKARLSFIIEEYWKEQFSHSLSCGRSTTYKVKKTTGVTVTEREELEGKASISLGLKGISELKSEIKSKMKLEQSGSYSGGVVPSYICFVASSGIESKSFDESNKRKSQKRLSL